MKKQIGKHCSDFLQMNSQDKHIPKKSIWLALMYPKVIMKYIVKVNMKRILRKDKTIMNLYLEHT